LAVRRLKPGTYEQFRAAWQPQRWWPGLTRVWISRNSDDPDIVATWALLDLDESHYEAMRDDKDWLRAESHRLGDASRFVEEFITSGFFQVEEDITVSSSQEE
jgi:hypothetical protein